MKYHFSIVDLRAWAISVLLKKISHMRMHSSFFSTFSSFRFSVSGFMVISLIHLHLSFVQGNTYGPIFILLLTDHQLDQHHLLKMLSFFPWYGFDFFVKDQVSKVYGFISASSILFHWLTVSVPIPCSFYHYCSVVQLVVRDGDAPSSFIVENCFPYPGLFVIPDEFENCSFYLCEELSWNFYGDCIESVDCFW